MPDTRPCHELMRPALIERVARALRHPELLADPRIPAGRCALCLENLPRSYHVVDMRGGRVESRDVEPGSAAEAEALKLRGVPGVWLTAVKLCACAERTEIQREAELLNRERMRPKPAPAKAEDNFSGGERY